MWLPRLDTITFIATTALFVLCIIDIPLLITVHVIVLDNPLGINCTSIVLICHAYLTFFCSLVIILSKLHSSSKTRILTFGGKEERGRTVTEGCPGNDQNSEDAHEAKFPETQSPHPSDIDVEAAPAAAIPLSNQTTRSSRTIYGNIDLDELKRLLYNRYKIPAATGNPTEGQILCNSFPDSHRYPPAALHPGSILPPGKACAIETPQAPPPTRQCSKASSSEGSSASGSTIPNQKGGWIAR